jgi:hypothetical protein
VISLKYMNNVVVGADASSRLIAHRLSGGGRHLTCDEVLFELAVERAINDVLSHPDIRCVLVSTPSIDILLSTYGVHLSALEQRPGFTRNWYQHPKDPSKLIAFAEHRLEVYIWEDLMQAGQHAMPICVLETRTPGVAQQPGSNHIAIKFSDPSATRSLTRTMLLDALMLEGDLNASTENSFLQTQNQSQFVALEHTTGHIFGYIGTRMIFLDRTGWICSTDLEMFTEEFYLRHFFIPADWLSTNPELIGVLTCRHDLVFAQRNEIAVVKRGFDNSEQVPLVAEDGGDVKV